MTLERLQVIIEAYTKPYRDELEKVKRQTTAATNHVERQTAKMKHSFGKIAGIVAAALSVTAIVRFGKSCIQLGSDLAEVQNVVDVTFGDMSRQVNAFAQGAITQFGLSELTAKKYMSTYGAMAKAFGFSTDQTYGLAKAVTELTGDVASFYNLSTDEAFEKLKSIWTGETETLKSIGVVMTQTALDQYALNNGFGKTTAKMTEQEKVMLRYRFVMDSLSDASGDFARTSRGWANQTRVLALQFESLKATIGQGLINAFTPVIHVINTILAKLQTLANYFKALTTMLFGNAGGGQTISGAADSLAGAAGSSGAIADNMDQAAGAAKKMKEYTLGIDELNILSPDDGGGGSGGGGGEEAPDFGSMSGELFGNVTVNPEVEEAVLRMKEALDRLKEAAQPTLEAIKRLWNEGLAKLGKFSGTTLKDFYKNFLLPVGKWSLGEAGLPRFFNITNDLLNKINWDRLNGALADLFTELQKPAEFVWTGLMDFYEYFLKPIGVWAVGDGLPRLLDICSRLVSAVNWDRLNAGFRDLWDALGPFAASVGAGLISFVEDLIGILTPIVGVTLDALADGLSAIGNVINMIPAPVVEALGGAIGGLTTAILVFKGMEVVVGVIDGIKGAMGSLITAIAANPVLAAVGTVSALTGALLSLSDAAYNSSPIGEYARAMEDLSRKIKDTSDNILTHIDTSRDYVENAGAAEMQMARDLADKYYELADKENKSAAEKAQMKRYAEDLCEIIPELNGYIDDQTGYLTAQQGTVEDLIERTAEYYRLQAAKDILMDAYRDQINAQKNLKDATEALKIAQMNYNGAFAEQVRLYDEAAANGGPSLSLDADAWDNLMNSVDGYKKVVDDLTPAYKSANEALVESNANIEYLNSIISETQGALDGLNFVEVAVSAASAIDAAHGVWVDGKQVLGQDAVDLYNEFFGNLQLENGMTQMADGSIVAFGTALNKGKEDVQSTFDDVFVAALKDRLPDGYKLAQDSGGYVVEGFNAGINANAKTTNDAYQKWLEDGDKTITDYWEIRSPSKKSTTYGGYVVEGFNIGIAEAQDSSKTVLSEWSQNVGTWFTQGLDASIPKTDIYGQNILQGIISGFRATYGAWTTALNEWYTTYIAPWFTDQRWNGLYDPIKAEMRTKWSETVRNWRTDITSWWNEDVSPWWEKNEWDELFDTIRESLGFKWGEAWKAWKADMEKWWTEDVITWLAEDRWTGAMTGIPQAFQKTFQEAVEVSRRTINKLLDYLNTMEISVPEFEVDGETFGGYSFPAFSVRPIPQLADGGILDSGQLFVARESGPEIVGKYGSRTGVVNNDQIVEAVSRGVADAVSDVLNQGGGEEKIEVNLTVDGRTLAQAVAETNRRSGFKFRK